MQVVLIVGDIAANPGFGTKLRPKKGKNAKNLAVLPPCGQCASSRLPKQLRSLAHCFSSPVTPMSP